MLKDWLEIFFIIFATLNCVAHPDSYHENRATQKSHGLVAQLNRASDYGSEGYRFESYRGH